MIVHFPPARLNDVNIFLSHRLLDFDPSLTDGKFGEEDISLGDSEMVANGLCELRMGSSPDNNDVPNHGCGVVVSIRSTAHRSPIFGASEVKTGDEVGADGDQVIAE